MKQELIPNVFSALSARSYEAFYRTPYGKTIDRLEKALMEKLVREALHYSESSSLQLLEVGCGTGVWTDFFARLGFTVMGIDPSEAMLEVARSKNIPRATYKQAVAEDLPFPPRSFDAVAAITVLEFVEDLSLTVREIERVLKPGGVFFGGFLNRDSELGRRQAEDPIIRHASLYNKAEIEGFLSSFQDVVIEGCVYLCDKGEVMDGKAEETRFSPAFYGVRATKLKGGSAE